MDAPAGTAERGMSMKIRLTLLTENDKQRPPELTEEKVKAVWQLIGNTMCLFSDNDDTCVVEKVEFVEEEA